MSVNLDEIAMQYAEENETDTEEEEIVTDDEFLTDIDEECLLPQYEPHLNLQAEVDALMNDMYQKFKSWTL